jgi:hypothetical protein
MADDTYLALMDQYDRWDDRQRRRGFIARMEHKLRAKEDRYRR